MRTIKTLGGTPIEPDGDALLVIETIYTDLTRRYELAYGFEDVDRAITHVIDQMTEEDLRVYLKESLFMSFNRYESERMLEIVKRASQAMPAKADAKGQKAKRTGQGAQGARQMGKRRGRSARKGQNPKGRKQVTPRKPKRR